MINRGGKKISIGEVGASVAGVQGVRDIAAVGCSADFGERCGVCSSAILASISRHCAAISRLAVLKTVWPKRIETIHVLPVAVSGKVDRRSAERANRRSRTSHHRMRREPCS